jgi:hypothetical protein
MAKRRRRRRRIEEFWTAGAAVANIFSRYILSCYLFLHAIPC